MKLSHDFLCYTDCMEEKKEEMRLPRNSLGMIDNYSLAIKGGLKKMRGRWNFFSGSFSCSISRNI